MEHMVSSQEMRAAIAELTRSSSYTTRSELYEKYFRDADRAQFDQTLWLLGVEGLVSNRPHPEVADDRLLALTEEGRALRAPQRAIQRGRGRRAE